MMIMKSKRLYCSPDGSGTWAVPCFHRSVSAAETAQNTDAAAQNADRLS